MISEIARGTQLAGNRVSHMTSQAGRLVYLALGLSYLASYYVYEPILMIGLGGLATALFRPLRLTDLAFAFLVVDIRTDQIESAINYSQVATVLFGLLLLKTLVSGRFALSRPIVFPLALFFLYWLALFLFSFNEVSLVNALQDMRIAIVGMAAALVVGGPKPSDKDLEKLIWFLGGVLAAFLVYIVLTPGNKFYISMDSIKALVIFPSLYAIMKNRSILGMALAGITLFVLTYFSTRYLFVSYLGALGILLVYKSPAKAAAGIPVAIVTTVLLSQYSFEFSRILTILDLFRAPDVDYYGPFFSQVANIDRLRAMEGYYVFADANLPQLLFGRGFGAQIRDTAGFVNYDLIGGTAYSAGEIQARQFSNLHDPVIEWQLRYGALCLAGFGVFCLMCVVRGLRESSFLSYVLPFIALNCYWSGKGLFVTAVILVFAAHEWWGTPRKMGSKSV